MSNPKYVKGVIVPCPLNADGKVSTIPSSRPPYGYHHILGIYNDGSFELTATVFLDISDDNISNIAKIIFGNLPIETDPDYYLK